MDTYCGLNDSRTHEHASDCYVPREPAANEAAERLPVPMPNTRSGTLLFDLLARQPMSDEDRRRMQALIPKIETEHVSAERRATVERIDWQAVRSAISNAYYETREAGGTMEAAADRAVAHVRAILDEEAAR